MQTQANVWLWKDAAEIKHHIPLHECIGIRNSKEFTNYMLDCEMWSPIRVLGCVLGVKFD